MAKREYKAIPAKSGTDRTLYSNADLKSRFKIDIKPLVIPHPKQDIPKMFLMGHRDTEKILVNIYRQTKKIKPAPRERKVYLFLKLSGL